MIVPLAMPAILAGAALAFVTSIGNFGIPAMLGIPGRYTVLTTLIYQRLQGFGPRVLGEVAALALILAALAVIGLLLRALVVRRGGFAAEGASAPLQPFRLGARPRRCWRPCCGSRWSCIAVLPLLALLASSLAPALGVPLRFDTVTLANYRFALFEQESTLRAFANSFVLALAAAAISAAVAVPLAYLVDAAQESRRARARPAGRRALCGAGHGARDRDHHRVPAAAAVPRRQPLRHDRHHPRRLSRALPGAGAAADRRRHGTRQQEPRRGRAGRRRRRHHGGCAPIILPAVAPSAAAGALLIFMTAFNELTVSVLLWSTGRETLGVAVFFLHYEGNSPAAAAVATISIVVTLALAMLTSLLARNLPEGVVPWRA